MASSPDGTRRAALAPLVAALLAVFAQPHAALASPNLTRTAATSAAPAETFVVPPRDSLPFERPVADSLASPDSLVAEAPFAAASDSLESEPEILQSGEWLRAPFGEDLLTDPDAWAARGEFPRRIDPVLDYNRVDQLRLGLRVQAQSPDPWTPRAGARIEYALGRKRTLYGAQIEQPLLTHGRLAIGASMIRTTDHSELHQVDDLENSLALLFGRQDYRDYFEREGFGAYLATRLPGISTVSAHLRRDEYRSLPLRASTRSWFHRDRALRDNPAILEGEAHRVSLRSERLAHRTRRTRAGLYHWIELEEAGGRLGGDFRYRRVLGDVRSVVRLSPATTLAMRAVGGATTRGVLPPQREFTAGGVDGLRAHAFSEYRGDQIALAQAEYNAGLWTIKRGGFEGGLHAIAFVDVGRAWRNADGWNPQDQRFAVDGGLGLATSEDNLRVYVAKNLQDPDAAVVISARLQRPF